MCPLRLKSWSTGLTTSCRGIVEEAPRDPMPGRWLIGIPYTSSLPQTMAIGCPKSQALVIGSVGYKRMRLRLERRPRARREAIRWRIPEGRKEERCSRAVRKPRLAGKYNRRLLAASADHLRGQIGRFGGHQQVGHLFRSLAKAMMRLVTSNEQGGPIGVVTSCGPLIVVGWSSFSRGPGHGPFRG